jgi:hypothetical protein
VGSEPLAQSSAGFTEAQRRPSPSVKAGLLAPDVLGELNGIQKQGRSNSEEVYLSDCIRYDVCPCRYGGGG